MQKIKNSLIKSLPFILSVLGIVLLIFMADDAFARKGGAGGGGSGGGGGDFLEIVFYIFAFIPTPYNFIVLAIVIALYWFAKKKMKQQSVLNQMPTGETKKARGYDNFIANNPDFNEAKFKTDVEEAFIQLQYAWQDKNMDKVRHFISDGMYQRDHTQFVMMDILEQKNVLEKVKVKNVYIDKIESDGLYDIIHVAVHASIVDKFKSEKYSKLNSGGAEEFVEYWSFIKKRGIETKDLFSSHNCPKCGAEIPADAKEISKCAFCGTVMNSPEYGWILSEITQADDYIAGNPLASKAHNLDDKIMEMIHDNEDFSVQLLEDKASNGYLQVETARVKNDPSRMRRFVTDAAFDKLSTQFASQKPFVYNRLFLNDVSLIGVGKTDSKNLMMISIKSSYQRVIPGEKSVEFIDAVVSTKTEFVLMERDLHPTESKGSIYTHSCPSCGGGVSDTLDLVCPFCGSQVNSSSNEWIISDILSGEEYNTFYAENNAIFYTPVKPEKLDALYKVRDYAFNNVLIMIAADGVFDEEERKFAEKLAKKWGYNLNKIQPMVQMAESGKLVLRMPDDKNQRKKIYHLMEKAAKADQNVSPEEQELLDSVKSQYLS
ncbi:MAG: TIM44-like domain-containing protein [Bacteroidetes bacterium]|nr:TIM44-like domain-containing protein [Bacteroidota bacterium]MBU1720236.1 TIM44-like domain-containing protein [Bacteroidota bacterium]